MLRFVGSQLRFRRGRAAALGLGILVLAVAFALLTAATSTSALRSRGTIGRTYRTAYDVLVRPKGSETPLERSEGLVRDNYLSGNEGGISFAQWHTIEHVPGVAVAAPIANAGYILPFRGVPISIRNVITNGRFQLYRLRLSWSANGGLSHYPYGSAYVYYTRRDHFFLPDVHASIPDLELGPDAPKDGVPTACDAFGAVSPIHQSPFGFNPYLECYAGKSFVSVARGINSLPPKGFVGIGAAAYFPLAVAAIDPVAEAKLVHLDRAVVRGRYLRPGDTLRFGHPDREGIRAGTVPILLSDHSYVDDRMEVAIERLRLPRLRNVPAALATGACLRNYVPCPAPLVVPPPAGFPYKNSRELILRLPGRTVERRSIPVDTFYRGQPAQLNSFAVWTVSPTRYRVLGPDHLAPLPVHNPTNVWTSPFSGYAGAPYDSADVQFRRLRERQVLNKITDKGIPQYEIVGHFDPRKLPGYSPLSRVPLETYYPPVLEPADAASRRALHGRPYLPTQNLGGYVAQPPLVLTTMAALRDYFMNPRWWLGLPGIAPAFPRGLRAAPIGAIRVRVAGVTGPDPASRQRVRVVAEEIHRRTGLQVDVTVGSSPHPLLISLPKGRFGQPPLLLREGWSKKGVAVVFLNAVDRKSLGLFLLALLVSGFFLTNGALAVARTRRREVGTLQALGWTRAAVFRALLGEIVLVGLVAGVVGTDLAAALVAALSLDLAAWKLAAIVPISVALAALAGVAPAWRTARLSPVAALRAPVVDVRRARRVRRIAALALVNLGRVPARTLVGAAGLAVGTAALTFVIAIERSFQGTLVGTLLGNALAIQVHGVDLAAVGLIVGLAAVSVADVLYLNVRQRAAELVTLRSFGWDDRQLSLLVALEALGLGLLGSSVGALTGLVLAAVLLDVALGPLAVAAVLAGLGGTLTALVASLVPLSRLRRLTPPAVLAAE
jgi:putative ABC transport system permease protein